MVVDNSRLTKSQVKVLKALKETDFKKQKFKTRKQISKATKIQSGFGYIMGTPNSESQPNSLESQGLIGSITFEGSREINYYITAKGKSTVSKL
jgi:hypothetical protein